MKSPYIMGFQKCGINSIIRHYKDTPNLHTTEDITSIHCVPTFMPFIETHYPVVIIRNKVDAIWSIYWFFGYWKSHTLEQFLVLDEPNIQYGNTNPINRVDFDYHISKFDGIADVTVFDVDKMGADFPVTNTTQALFDSNKSDHFGYREYTEEESLLILKYCKSYNREKLKHKVRLV